MPEKLLVLRSEVESSNQGCVRFPTETSSILLMLCFLNLLLCLVNVFVLFNL